MTQGVTIWWAVLSALTILNLGLWSLSYGAFFRSRTQAALARPGARFDGRAAQVARWPHLVLSGVYVLGCGFRSLLPRADVQRIVLYDSFLSSVLVGRSVATLAELCFVAQWALLLNELSRAQRSQLGIALSYAIVPLIAVAECCSWYAVLSTNYLGNALEQSIWTCTALLVSVALVPLWRTAHGRLSWFLAALMVLCVGFVLFMSTVDVPMYLTRWQADQLAARPYLSLAEGLRDVAERWVVTHRWLDWHEEIAWMSLYFSLAVWMSIALAHAPRAQRQVELAQAGAAQARRSSAPSLSVGRAES